MEDVADIVSVELAVPPDERLRLDGFKSTDNPLGESENAKVTVPANPFRLVRDTLVVNEDPCVRVKVPTPEVIEKSGGSGVLITAVTVTT